MQAKEEYIMKYLKRMMIFISIFETTEGKMDFTQPGGDKTRYGGIGFTAVSWWHFLSDSEIQLNL